MAFTFVRCLYTPLSFSIHLPTYGTSCMSNTSRLPRYILHTLFYFPQFLRFRSSIYYFSFKSPRVITLFPFFATIACEKTQKIGHLKMLCGERTRKVFCKKSFSYATEGTLRGKAFNSWRTPKELNFVSSRVKFPPC